MAEPLLQAHSLSCSYGEYQALKPIDLTLQAGDRVALVGPNGSGKTTLLNCLSGLLPPTTGEIHLEGHNLYHDERPARQCLAFVPDVPVFYQELTAWEHIQAIALAHRVSAGYESRARELLSEFGLWEARDLFPHAYSRGMRLKLALVLALIRPFSVLLLDEPTSALDTESTQILCARLQALAQGRVAFLLSTHDPQLAEQLGANIWSMHAGTLTIS